MTTTFKPTHVCVLDYKNRSYFGLPLMCKPDDSGERDANAILVPNTPAYRAAIASVGRGKKPAKKNGVRGRWIKDTATFGTARWVPDKKPTPKPARSRRKA